MLYDVCSMVCGYHRIGSKVEKYKAALDLAFAPGKKEALKPGISEQ